VKPHRVYDNRWFRRIILSLAIIGTFCILYGWLIEPYNVEVTTHTIATPLIPEGKKVRIVQLSDLHCEEETSRERQLPELVNALQPDIIVLTGDYNNSASGLATLDRLLRSLRPKQGIYGVYGNFCYSFHPEEILLRHKITLLDGGKLDAKNEPAIKADIDCAGTPISIYGCDVYGDSDRFTDVKPDPKRFNVFLHHTPDMVEEIAGHGYQLYLSGHTHGGQVRLPFYGAMITLSKFDKKYEMGKYQLGDMTAYVHRGVGMEGGLAPRVRFLCRPEIAVFDLIPQVIR
jgi:predicted MPP superfamily phosphohydrolase